MNCSCMSLCNWLGVHCGCAGQQMHAHRHTPHCVNTSLCAFQSAKHTLKKIDRDCYSETFHCRLFWRGMMWENRCWCFYIRRPFGSCYSSILRNSFNYLNAACRPFFIYFGVFVCVREFCKMYKTGAFTQSCMYSLVFKEIAAMQSCSKWILLNLTQYWPLILRSWLSNQCFVSCNVPTFFLIFSGIK